MTGNTFPCPKDPEAAQAVFVKLIAQLEKAKAEDDAPTKAEHLGERGSQQEPP